MPTRIPDDFYVTDAHKKYCDNKGYPPPEMFITEFKDHFEAKGTRYDNWDRCFQNWIRNQSPAGRFYDARTWEIKVQAAKRKEASDAKHNPLLQRPVRQRNTGAGKDEFFRKAREDLGL